MTDLLPRATRALTYDEVGAFLRRRLGDAVVDVVDEYGTFEVHLTAAGYVEAARLCRDEPRLNFDLFDCLFGIDAREDGFDLVAILYSTATAQRICLRHRCEGGREAPVAPTLTDVYLGADWMEREAWDMFGIEFEGHPGLAPRILCDENFEGWPLRKDFYLASREAKPWPGVKEPAELDEDGNVIERVPGPGGAPGPTALDEAMAKQAKLANPEPEPVAVVRDPDAPGEAEVLPASADEGAAEPTGKSDQASDRVVQGEGDRADEDADAAESQARARAEEKRVAAAEARARRAAERGDAHGVSTPAEDTADVPKDADRDPGRPDAGGPPSTVSDDAPAPSAAESPIEAGIDESAEDARRRGEVEPDAADAPVEPEGREVRGDGDEPGASS